MKNDRRWFKCYARFWLDDAAIRRLPADYLLVYQQLYSLCALDGDGDFIEGDTDDLAWRVHRSSEFMEKALASLHAQGLVDQTPTGVTVRLWNAEQPEISDAERVRAYRARKNKDNQQLS